MFLFTPLLTSGTALGGVQHVPFLAFGTVGSSLRQIRRVDLAIINNVNCWSTLPRTLYSRKERDNNDDDDVCLSLEISHAFSLTHFS